MLIRISLETGVTGPESSLLDWLWRGRRLKKRLKIMRISYSMLYGGTEACKTQARITLDPGRSLEFKDDWN
ncbi:MAG: hypothetical protein A2036_03975 [Omnitrophica bacterium GWA2_50_21]|nr:MAG: hypothetical protein A2036_03975 [Omnitrophica bacterium GWA2_50_21]